MRRVRLLTIAASVIVGLVFPSHAGSTPGCQSYPALDTGQIAWSKTQLGGGFPTYLEPGPGDYLFLAAANLLYWGDSSGVDDSPLYLTGIIQDLTGNGSSHLYVACEGIGIRVIDVSNPENPTLVTDVPLPYEVSALDVDGTRLVVVGVTDGPTVLDVSNPAGPVVLGTSSAVLEAAEIVVDANRAYVADAGIGVTVFDVSGNGPPLALGAALLEGAPHSIDLVSTGIVVVATLAGELHTVDATDPTAPMILGRHATSGEPTVRVYDDMAYVVGGRARTLAYDVSNPSDIRFRYAAPLYYGSIVETDVLARDDALYLGVVGVTKYEVGPHQLEPHFVADFTPDTLNGGVTIHGSTAYIRGRDDILRIVDFSDMFAPTIRGTAAGFGAPLNAEVAGGTVLVTTGPAGNGLVFTDVSDPATPSFLAQVSTGDRITKAIAHGNTVYASAFSDGLVVVDLSDPMLPTPLPSVPVDFAFSCAAVGDVVYVADATVGSAVQIVDASDPATASVVGTIPGTDGCWWTVASGTQLYVNLGNTCILFDATDPLVPVPIVTIDSNAFPIQIIGPRALMTVNDGLEIVDFSNPAQPVQVAKVPLLRASAVIPRGGDWIVFDTDHDYMVVPGDCGTLSATPAPATDRVSGVRILDRHPNPFNPRVRVEYAVQRGGDVEVGIYTVDGRLVDRPFVGPRTAGRHYVDWRGLDLQGRPVASGVYLVRIGDEQGADAVTKVVLAR